MTKFSYLTVFILVSFVSFPFRLEAAFSPYNSLGRQKKNISRTESETRDVNHPSEVQSLRPEILCMHNHATSVSKAHEI